MPKQIVPHSIQIAGEWDGQLDPSENYESSLVINAKPADRRRPVNVASVPHRSPFRYPGGKTWLVPYVRQWLQARKTRPALLVEPFAGGGSVGLTAGFEGFAEGVILVERDPFVAAVWKTIFSKDAEWLCRRILSFEMTLDAVRRVLRDTSSLNPKEELNREELREQAFATILRNRTQRGGILAPGAGLLKQGEGGRGLKSRWYPQTLARRIREIYRVRDRFTFLERDGIEVIRKYSRRKNVAFFVDPPYTVAAKRLYHYWEIDHRNLFELLVRSNGDVLLTYAYAKEIRDLAKEFGFENEEVAMKNTHHTKMSELLIGRNLKWLGNCSA